MFYPMSAVQSNFGLLFAFGYLYLTMQGGRAVLALVVLSCAFINLWRRGRASVVRRFLSLRCRDWQRLLSSHASAGRTACDVSRSGGASERTRALSASRSSHSWQTLRLFVGVLGSPAEVPIFRLYAFSPYLIIPLGVTLILYSATVGYRVSKGSR